MANCLADAKNYLEGTTDAFAGDTTVTTQDPQQNAQLGYTCVSASTSSECGQIATAIDMLVQSGGVCQRIGEYAQAAFDAQKLYGCRCVPFGSEEPRSAWTTRFPLLSRSGQLQWDRGYLYHERSIPSVPAKRPSSNHATGNGCARDMAPHGEPGPSVWKQGGGLHWATMFLVAAIQFQFIGRCLVRRRA